MNPLAFAGGRPSAGTGSEDLSPLPSPFPTSPTDERVWPFDLLDQLHFHQCVDLAHLLSRAIPSDVRSVSGPLPGHGASRRIRVDGGAAVQKLC